MSKFHEAAVRGQEAALEEKRQKEAELRRVAEREAAYILECMPAARAWIEEDLPLQIEKFSREYPTAPIAISLEHRRNPQGHPILMEALVRVIQQEYKDQLRLISHWHDAEKGYAVEGYPDSEAYMGYDVGLVEGK